MSVCEEKVKRIWLHVYVSQTSECLVLLDIWTFYMLKISNKHVEIFILFIILDIYVMQIMEILLLWRQKKTSKEKKLNTKIKNSLA